MNISKSADRVYIYSATIWLGSRIAPPEMFLNAGPLPHVICSPVGWDCGGDNEATEHGDSKRTDGRCGAALQRGEPRGEGANSRRVCGCDGLPSKHAMRLLRGDIGQSSVRRTRRRFYEEAERNALVVLWEASDRICGKRLKALLPFLIESMERNGHMCLAPEIRAKLLAMSASTIDRALGKTR